MPSSLGSSFCSLPNDTKAASLGSAVIKAELSMELDGMNSVAAIATCDDASSASSPSSDEKEKTVATCSSESPTPSGGAGADGLQDSASALLLLFPE